MPVNITAFGTDGENISLVSAGNNIVENGIADFLFVLGSADHGDTFRLKQILDIVRGGVVHIALRHMD
jgi:hypothetical protein